MVVRSTQIRLPMFTDAAVVCGSAGGRGWFLLSSRRYLVFLIEYLPAIALTAAYSFNCFRVGNVQCVRSCPCF